MGELNGHGQREVLAAFVASTQNAAHPEAKATVFPSTAGDGWWDGQWFSQVEGEGLPPEGMDFPVPGSGYLIAPDLRVVEFSSNGGIHDKKLVVEVARRRFDNGEPLDSASLQGEVEARMSERVNAAQAD
jgi:hypothetical protein